MFLLDRQNERFVAVEARDQSIYRPHGFEAARKLGLEHRFSYGPHWRVNPYLRERVFTIQAANNPALADVEGGLDIDGGTWLAFNRRTGVYCRIFSAGWDDNTRTDSEFLSPSGLPIDGATADSAQHAVELLEKGLLPALDSSRQLPGFQLVVADSRDAFVVAFDGRDSVTTTPLAAGRPHVLTTNDEFGKQLQTRAESSQAPTEILTSWGPWLSAFTATGTDYGNERWTADANSAIRPPYCNTAGPDRYQNVRLFPETDPSQAAWTKSVSLYSAGKTGAELFAYNERQLFDYQPLPTEVRRMGFPTTTDDFFVVIANENS
ncbi:hypothetical protein AB0M22_27010 [Nocardia sp. NPDC051756]|uniref:hypothetical protein n=1 Tax=Nocardia sp. NPDC051756 TaxID=3154751 RepID=UPI00344127F0